MERIKIDDGSKTYEIVNLDDQVIGTFTFNPSDMSIIERYDAVVKSLEEYFNSIREAGFTQQALIDAQNAIKEKLKELIGGDAIDSFFAICAPFTPMQNGSLYLEVVVNALGEIIEKETKKRMKKVETRMDKYLKDYKKS
jgi:hypothetical protein